MLSGDLPLWQVVVHSSVTRSAFSFSGVTVPVTGILKFVWNRRKAALIVAPTTPSTVSVL